MRPLVVTEFVSLDGVMQAPEQWVFDYHDQDTLRYKTEEISEVDALLLGERTYETFAASWPTMTGPLADRMNGIAKYVMTRHPHALAWSNSTPLGQDTAAVVADLKHSPGRPILVAGSRRLVDILARHHLVDEYRLFVCPVVLSRGERLFPPRLPTAMRLAESRRFHTGALLVRYTLHPTHRAPTGVPATAIRRSA
jgi:dihydrofolate reductase